MNCLLEVMTAYEDRQAKDEALSRLCIVLALCKQDEPVYLPYG